MGSTTSTTNTSYQNQSSSQPWTVQQPYLTGAWADAQNILNDRTKSGPYSGNFVATDKSGQQADAFNSAYNWAGQTGKSDANNMYNTGAGQLQTGTGAQNGAVAGLNNFLGQDQTANNINTANAYSNNPHLQDMVNAATYAANRDAAENTIPNMYASAAQSGNLNSDRTALAQGVVQRGLAENAQNIAAQYQYNQYQNGLTMAQQQAQQQLGAYSALGSLGSSVAGQGYAGTNQGFNAYGQASQMQQGAAYGTNMLDQSQIDNGLKKWYNAYQYPQNNLNDYYGIVGSNNWGNETQSSGTQQSQTTQTPSIGSMIGQGIGLFGSLFCDKRFKTVLSGKVGEFRGFPTYFYTYRGDPSATLYCGPMAQEVQATRPDAVFEREGKLFIDLNIL